MPPKIRDLERLLEQAGFVKRAARGSHRKWVHPAGVVVVLSGKEGGDAKPYQENLVEAAIARARR